MLDCTQGRAPSWGVSLLGLALIVAPLASAAQAPKADSPKADAAAKTNPAKAEPTKAEPAKAEPTKADPPKAESTAGLERLAQVVGVEVDIELKSGTVLKQAKFLDVTRDPKTNEIRGLSVSVGGAKRLVSLSGLRKVSAGDETLYEATAGDKPAPKTAAQTKEEREKAAAEAFAKRKEEWLERLEARGIRPWPAVSDEEEKKAVEAQKELRDRITKAFPGMQVAETEHFLVTTNIPIPQMQPYVASLDKMYDMMCKLYRIKEGTRVFKGKALIAAFLNREEFYRFEVEFMQNPDPVGAYGICHNRSDGIVVVGCYRGDRPNEFGHMLVHETSHGFIFRFNTPVRVPSWVNEGMADYIGATIVPGSVSMKLREKEAHERMLQTRSMGGILSVQTNIDAWQYGVASSLTRFLIQTNSKSYVEFVEDLKEGAPWQEALQKRFNGTPEELVAAYGKAMGIPNLQP